MKKGLYILLLCLTCFFTVFGCSNDFNEIVYKNISEQVETYFCGVGEFKAKISSGERENPYTYNGKTGSLVDFAILSVICDYTGSMIQVEITINEQTENKILELNTINGEFVIDLERKINQDDNVSVKYNNQELTLECRSKQFNINYLDALSIGIGTFEQDLKNLFSKNKLLAEIYLRVLDSAQNNFNRAYWYFYVYAENQTTYSCVIDVNSGEIVVKN